MIPVWLRAVFCCALVHTVVSEEIVVRRIDSIEPSVGSTAGGTRVVISGTGFSVNYIEGGNKIWIGDAECITVEQSGFGACTVLCSNFNQVVCDTTAHSAANNLDVDVTVDLLYPVPNPSNVKFSYVDGKAGMLRSIYPQSGIPGTVLNFYGNGWSTMTDSSNNNIGKKLSSFNNVLVGSETARVSSADGAAVCDRDELNYYKPRYFSTPDSFNPDDAYLSTYAADHYRCRLPVYAAGSYKTRINTVYGDVQKESSAKATNTIGTEYEFQYYADVRGVSPKVSGINGHTSVHIEGTGFSTIPEENQVTMNGLACNVTGSTYYTIDCETSAMGSTTDDTPTHLGGRGLSMYTTPDLSPSGDQSTFKWRSNRRGGWTDCDLRCYYDNHRAVVDTDCTYLPCTDYEIREHWLENSNDPKDCLCESMADGNASRVEAINRYNQFGSRGDIVALHTMELLPKAVPMGITGSTGAYRRRTTAVEGGASAFTGQYLEVVRQADGSMVFELDTGVKDMLRPGVTYSLSFTYRTDGQWSGGDDTNLYVFDPLLIPNTTATMASSVEPVEITVNIEVNANNETIECYDASDGGRSYRGHVTHNIYGEGCQQWSTDDPNTISWNDAQTPSPHQSENFCRNYAANGQVRPWCYRRDRAGWHYCDVKVCDRHAVVFRSLDASFIQISDVKLTDDDQMVTIISATKHFSADDLHSSSRSLLETYGNATAPEPIDSDIASNPYTSSEDAYTSFDPTTLNVAADGLMVRQIDEYTEKNGQLKLTQPSNYGALLKGMFVAPATGTYKFAITGDMRANLKTGGAAYDESYQSTVPQLSTNQAMSFQEDKHATHIYRTSDSYMMHRNFNWPARAFTVEFWIKLTTKAGTADQGVLSYSNMEHDNAVLIHRPHDLYLYLDGSAVDTNFDLRNKGWTHIAWSWKSHTGSSTLYVNGEINKEFTGHRDGQVIEGQGTLLFGQENDFKPPFVKIKNQNFVGHLDEVRIWDHARPASFIKAFFMADLVAEGMLANWKFTSGNGIDSSGNGWHLISEGVGVADGPSLSTGHTFAPINLAQLRSISRSQAGTPMCVGGAKRMSNGTAIGIVILNSESSVKTINLPYSDLVCPETLSKANWLNDDIDSVDDTFSVSIDGDQATITRTDAESGWSVMPRMPCYRAHPSGPRVSTETDIARLGLVPCDHASDITVLDEVVSAASGRVVREFGFDPSLGAVLSEGRCVGLSGVVAQHDCATLQSSGVDWSAVVNMPDPSYDPSTCTDTPGWSNGHSQTCANYADQWCADGAPRPGQEWAVSHQFNNPDENCCVCNGALPLQVCGASAGFSHGIVDNGVAGCSGPVSYAAASNFCALGNGRLPTKPELENGAAEATGCSYDAERVWTSSTCSEQGASIVSYWTNHAPGTCGSALLQARYSKQGASQMANWLPMQQMSPWSLAIFRSNFRAAWVMPPRYCTSSKRAVS